MLDLLLFPFRLIGGVLSALAGVAGGLIQLVFGLAGGVLSVALGFVFLIAGIALTVLVIRFVADLFRAA